MKAVAEQFEFIRTATPAELENEIKSVKASVSTLTQNGRVRTPLTEVLQNYLSQLRQARAIG